FSIENLQQRWFIESPRDVHCPQRIELRIQVLRWWVGAECVEWLAEPTICTDVKRIECVRRESSCCRPFLEQPSRMAHEPLVVADLLRRQFLISKSGKVKRRQATKCVSDLCGLPVRDFENPPARPVALLFLLVVAFTDIGPVGNIDAAIGAVFGV